MWATCGLCITLPFTLLATSVANVPIINCRQCLREKIYKKTNKQKRHKKPNINHCSFSFAAKGLNLYQVLAPNSFSYVDGYISAINRNVHSLVHERVRMILHTIYWPFSGIQVMRRKLGTSASKEKARKLSREAKRAKKEMMT